MKLTFANQITIARILAVPFFIVTILYYSPERDHIRLIAFGIFLFAVISDVIDGYIARKYKERTEAGAMLDPVADKALLMSALICIYKIGPHLPAVRFPLWFVVALISRDIILLAGAAIIQLVHNHLKIEPTFWGKASTFFQALSVGGVLLQISWIPVVWMVALILTVLSGIGYLISGMKVINAPPH